MNLESDTCWQSLWSVTMADSYQDRIDGDAMTKYVSINSNSVQYCLSSRIVRGHLQWHYERVRKVTSRYLAWLQKYLSCWKHSTLGWWYTEAYWHRKQTIIQSLFIQQPLEETQGLHCKSELEWLQVPPTSGTVSFDRSYISASQCTKQTINQSRSIQQPTKAIHILKRKSQLARLQIPFIPRTVNFSWSHTEPSWRNQQTVNHHFIQLLAGAIRGLGGRSQPVRLKVLFMSGTVSLN